MILLRKQYQLFNFAPLIYKQSDNASKYISKNEGSLMEIGAQATNTFLW